MDSSLKGMGFGGQDGGGDEDLSLGLVSVGRGEKVEKMI